MLKITYKVLNGKLLKLKLTLNSEKKVDFFELRGDFFMYPEDAFLDIEKFFVGKELNDELFESLQAYLDEHEVEIFGFSVDSLKEAINSSLE